MLQRKDQDRHDQEWRLRNHGQQQADDKKRQQDKNNHIPEDSAFEHEPVGEGGRATGWNEAPSGGLRRHLRRNRAYALARAFAIAAARNRNAARIPSARLLPAGDILILDHVPPLPLRTAPGAERKPPSPSSVPIPPQFPVIPSVPPIRVLRVIPDLQIGGVQRMLLKTLLALRKLGVEGQVCVLDTDPGELADEFARAQIPVHRIRFASRLDPRGLLALRALIRREAFSVVHGHMYAANMAINVATLGFPRPPRGLALVNGYHSQKPVSGASQARMVRLTRGRPGAWLAVAEAVAAPLRELGVPSHRIHIIHNGIIPPPEVAHLPALPASGATAAQPLRLVWAGRFVRQKRVPLLLEGLALAQQRAPGRIHLTLVGDGPGADAVRAVIDRHALASVVELAGFQRDVRPYLQAAHLYVSASDREGFPNAALEALAEARGFIGSDIPPHTELLGSSPCGVVVGDHGSAEGWASALLQLADAAPEVHAFSAGARTRALQLTVEETARKTCELYQSLLAGPR